MPLTPPAQLLTVLTSSPFVQAALNRAAQLELAGKYDDAFRLYVTSAQSFLHLSRPPTSSALATSPTSPPSPSSNANANAANPSPADQARYKALAKRALDRAEKIKAHKRDVRPVARERLGKAAQADVLDRAGSVRGRRYALWEGPSSTGATGAPAAGSAGVWEDPDGLLSLSVAQHTALASWQRPSTPLHSPELDPCDLVQETITDCSVVAALTVCVEHNARFGGRLALGTLYPQDADGWPARSPQGRYEVRLVLNGAERRVAVDDRLPVRGSGCLLCVSTRGSKALWPSLVEKAYLKVMGGYDFEGSNGSIDLHAITGWIPEHLRIVDAKFQRERAWRRLSRAFNEGKCLMTVGTGRSPGTFGMHQLTPYHAYAVIGLSEQDHARTVSLWNPWGRRREGVPSDEYAAARERPAQEGSGLREAEGPIRMEWDDLCGIFDSIYLNWDPGIFPHKAVVHSRGVGAFPLRLACPVTDKSSASNHQYNLTLSGALSEEADVWVLLSRHITGRDVDQSFIAAHVFHATEVDSLSVGRPSLEATYTDSPHVLVRTSRFPDESALSIIASRHGTGTADATYTLSVFSASPFTLSEPAHVYAFSQWVDGEFTAATAGGNALQPTFMRNPQYALTLKPGPTGASSPNGAQLRLSVHGSKDLPLHVQLVWGRGERVFDIRQTKTIKDSGTYNYGFGLCEDQVRPGTYTVIVSSFEPDTLGQYKLQIECSQAFEIKPIPQEGAGMFSRRLQGRWSGVASERIPQIPRYEVTLAKPTTFTARLQLVPPASITPVKLSLSIPGPHDTTQAELANSGSFSDSIAGALIQNIRLDAGTYLLVPSIVSAHVKADFIIQLYSTACSIKSRQV
ncbi:cysteine proteinase [Calocera cornea HHB12733]|uniref:Cysteine proteinase n=1 Tax=Calocera cornea HHB12733 TaxID=1353952 RepID=A0A165IZD2_9BASI|nr:cysteine proteinase [Calocera cornea HHB12733]